MLFWSRLALQAACITNRRRCLMAPTRGLISFPIIFKTHQEHLSQVKISLCSATGTTYQLRSLSTSEVGLTLLELGLCQTRLVLRSWAGGEPCTRIDACAVGLLSIAWQNSEQCSGAWDGLGFLPWRFKGLTASCCCPAHDMQEASQSQHCGTQRACLVHDSDRCKPTLSLTSH